MKEKFRAIRSPPKRRSPPFSMCVITDGGSIYNGLILLCLRQGYNVGRSGDRGLDSRLDQVSVYSRNADMDRGSSKRLRGWDNTLDSGGRNQIGRHSGFVVYRDRDLHEKDA